MNLDDELRSALQRREPRPGFAGRVLARVHQPAPRPRLAWLYWAAACAIAVTVLVGGGLDYRRRQQGERAKQEVMLALEIASTKLNFVQQTTLESMVNR